MKKILFALAMLAFGASALQQARADVSVDYFYDNLSGGNWIDVEGYGYGWQPDLAVNDSELASVRRRLLGLHGRRMDMDLVRGFRLGHLSLWPLGESFGLWLGLVSRRGSGLGSRMGLMADRWRLCRLGAFASTRSGRRL